MKRIILVLAALLALSSTALAERPATKFEKVVLNHAATVLRDQGVIVPDFPVTVSTLDEECAGADGGGYACTYPDHIELSQEAAGDARDYWRMLHARDRGNAIVGCYCMLVMYAAVHEQVHAARFLRNDLQPVWYEEGLADAVASDLMCVFEKRVVGRLALDCRTEPAYPGWTERIRHMSADATGYAWNSHQSRRFRYGLVSLF